MVAVAVAAGAVQLTHHDSNHVTSTKILDLKTALLFLVDQLPPQAAGSTTELTVYHIELMFFTGLNKVQPAISWNVSTNYICTIYAVAILYQSTTTSPF